MTTAADINALQAATAQAVKDLNSLATTQAALAAAQAALSSAQATNSALAATNATLVADKASLTTANAALTSQVVAYQGQVSDLTTRLAGAEGDVAALTPDANRWRKARIPDPTTYDQFFKDGGITSVSLSAAAADSAMDLALAGQTPAGTFIGMYSMTVVKP